MNTPAAIKGTFSDFRLIKGRKVAQLVVEVAIEQADAALATLGGLPRSDCERWVAIARLDLNALKTTRNENKKYHEDERATLDGMQESRREFCNLPYPQQAGIKSNDAHFQLWASNYLPEFSGEDCADAIRRWCNVKSRSEILPGTSAGDKWICLLREYESRR